MKKECVVSDNNSTRSVSNTLILLVGLPYSGKSTWANQQAAPIVCPDSIRLALHGQRFVSEAEPFVWAIAKTMAKSLFFSEHQRVIIDATNTTEKRRSFWRDDMWNIAFHHIDTSVEICLERARAINDISIIPVIERMAKQFEPILHNEYR